MDLSKTQQKYKHYACLCVSVMGQRRFRISMGALIPSPEAGDASVIIPQMKKCSITDDSSKSFVSMSERDIVNQRSLMSASTYNCINDVDKVAYKHMILMGDSVFDEMSNSTIYDKCQFPYYRFPDAVLVKDVGVSCMLLDEDTPVIHIPETKTLIKQLKKEYNDLSDITNKITTYTKDILGQLRKKDKRKRELLQHLMASKHAISSQYIDDKGNLCLKLRLLSNTGTQYTPEHILKNLEDALKDKCVAKKLHCKRSSTQILHKDKTPTLKIREKSKHEKDVQTEIHKEDMETSTIDSSSPSSSSVYNYLMMRKGKASSGKLKAVSTKLDDAEKYWNNKTRSNNKDCKEHLKRCDPVIFTNWKEISKSKQSKIKASSVISDESQEMTTTKKATSQCNRNIINNLPNTKIHSVNIRIVKQRKRPT
ncbi:uncharacterized protein LOC105663046 isoform X3 [Megachile rotundata]|uniref:uncharacterized protein LOC105663046 isoform X3 n=1 Tax=Megachile rotundata TaxID=143995 RepID=UPI003FD06A8A